MAFTGKFVLNARLLTAREHEVMTQVAIGLTNAEIARVLMIEASTVRKHLEHVFEKLGVGSRTAAVAKLRGSLRMPVPPA